MCQMIKIMSHKMSMLKMYLHIDNNYQFCEVTIFMIVCIAE